MKHILIQENDKEDDGGYGLEVMDNYYDDGVKKFKENPNADIVYVGINNGDGDSIASVGLTFLQIKELIDGLQTIVGELLED